MTGPPGPSGPGGTRGGGRGRGHRRGDPDDPDGGRHGERTPGHLAEQLQEHLHEPEPLHADELREPEPHWFNVPNGVTFLRALLVPVILYFLASEHPSARWWAFGIFVFAALTDSIDGWVARRWHGVTRWGQLADPIADKLLIIGSLASLASVGDLPWWAVIVIVVREVAVTAMRVGLVSRRDLVLPASVWGKAKTISQVVAVSLFLFPGMSVGVREAGLWVAVVLTVLSGLDYVVHVARLLAAGEKAT